MALGLLRRYREKNEPDLLKHYLSPIPADRMLAKGSSWNPAGEFVEGRHKKIAVRLSNWIGDAVMNIPALEAVRLNEPEAEIVAITRPWVKDVLSFRPDLVDRCIAFDDRVGTRHYLSFLGELREEKFDEGIVFTNHIKGAMLMCFSGIPIRTGFATTETRLFLNRSLARKDLPLGRHQSENYLDLVAEAGYSCKQRPAPRLIHDEAFNHQLITRFLSDLPRPILAVQAGASFGTAKRWLQDRYATVCAKFIAEHGGSVILLGTHSEAELNSTIAKDAGSRRVLDLTGKTSLRESMGLVSLADVFLSNDSGLAHVAAAFKTPQVTVFGPTDKTATAPYSPIAEVLYKPMPCSPCFHRHCPIGHDCMEAIEVAEVGAALNRALAIRGVPVP